MFDDDLELLVTGNSIQEVATSLEKIEEIVFRWRLSNTVTYDIAKTKAILFFRACSKKVKKEIAAIKLVFGE